MKVGSLFSGGKDSVFAVNWALEQKHSVEVLICIVSENKDSFMFHTPNIKLTSFQAEAAKLPIMYTKTLGVEEKELSDLKQALLEAKTDFGLEAITTGALASSYQKKRIEKICDELNLKCFSPLWKKNQTEYVKELIEKKFEVLISAVAAQGLDESWLGRKLDEKALDELVELNKKFDLNVAGEGGEYESFVLNAPFFKKRLKVVSAVKHWKGNAGFLEIKKIELVENGKKH